MKAFARWVFVSLIDGAIAVLYVVRWLLYEAALLNVTFRRHYWLFRFHWDLTYRRFGTMDPLRHRALESQLRLMYPTVRLRVFQNGRDVTHDCASFNDTFGFAIIYSRDSLGRKYKAGRSAARTIATKCEWRVCEEK